MERENYSTAIAGTGGIALGVFWYAWGKVGFWWALLYGIGWPVWLGFKMAEALNLGGS